MFTFITLKIKINDNIAEIGFVRIIFFAYILKKIKKRLHIYVMSKCHYFFLFIQVLLRFGKCIYIKH